MPGRYHPGHDHRSTFCRARDPYGGATGLTIDTPQARRRPITVTGPLPDRRGRFAELLRIRWLLDFGASGPVLESQRHGIPESYRMAGHAGTSALFDRLRRDGADVRQAIAAVEDIRAKAAPGLDP